MPDRTCDTCKRTMQHGDIRQRDTRTGGVVCSRCLEHPTVQPNKVDVTARRKVAHDGGDGETIRHCFSCGSGGVVGRSDGTTECTVCGQTFTVQVQPRNVNSPQTVNGVPVHIPGMPEQSEVAPASGDITGAPDALSGGQSTPAPVPGVEDADLMEFVTASGQRLSRDAFVQHLALSAAPLTRRQAVLDRIKTANERRHHG